VCKGDFEIAAMEELGNSVEVGWWDIRGICLGPGCEKYDLSCTGPAKRNYSFDG